jgi:hypothetical protein
MWALALAASACSSGMATPDGASSGMCGADVPAGQACNTLTNLGAAFTPVCKTGTPPSGTGGPIADGTYVLTGQDKYGSTSCSSPLPLAETLAIAGDCLQLVLGDVLSATGSARLTTQGNAVTFTRTCLHVDTDGAVVKDDATTKTYTATSTSFTLFETDATTGLTTVSVFTRR